MIIFSSGIKKDILICGMCSLKYLKNVNLQSQFNFDNVHLLTIIINLPQQIKIIKNELHQYIDRSKGGNS